MAETIVMRILGSICITGQKSRVAGLKNLTDGSADAACKLAGKYLQRV